MVRYRHKYKRDEAWLAAKIWTFPTGLHPDSEEELTRRKSHRPLRIELLEQRREHMAGLYEDCKNYALIANLYKLDRSLVRKIINDK